MVADGVGGGAMASLASREVVACVHASLAQGAVDEEAIRQALFAADREIARKIATHTAALGAATIALCAAARQDRSRWLIAWVGDCRVYRVRSNDREVELLTRDDTYRNVQEAPPPGGSPDDPARMLGNGAVRRPNVEPFHLKVGEFLVLCTDGVHKSLHAEDFARVLSERTALTTRCAQLVDLARTRGSHDDATVLVLYRRARRRRNAWIVGAIAIALAVTAAFWQAGDNGRFRYEWVSPPAPAEDERPAEASTTALPPPIAADPLSLPLPPNGRTPLDLR